MIRRHAVVFLTVFVLCTLALLIACSNSNSAMGTGTVSTSLSDPTTCSAPASGPYSNIYIAISDVQIHASSTVNDNDPNWIDLTPTLKNSGTPVQVDLLGLPDNSCFLKMLGSNTLIQEGSYQQIRIFLAENNAANAGKISGNKCGTNAVNCVVLAGSTTPQTLQLSSEAKNGMKIPSGQIAGGAFTIGAGQVKDLNIDINCCASIVVDQGNGQYRLKPVLHAGEVSLQSAITGTLMDASTSPLTPVTGGKAIVALEQKDSAGIDRVILQTVADPVTGQFSLCPVPAGTYDLVVVAVNGSNVVYATSITTGVSAAKALGNILMTPAPSSGASTAPGSIGGNITTLNASNAGTPVLVQVSALQTVNGTTYTIPAASLTATVPVITNSSGSGTYLFDHVPTVAPMIGAFSTSPPTTWAAGTVTPASSYVIEGLSFLATDSNTASCLPARQTTAPLAVTPSALTITAPAGNLPNFTGCQ